MYMHIYMCMYTCTYMCAYIHAHIYLCSADYLKLCARELVPCDIYKLPETKPLLQTKPCNNRTLFFPRLCITGLVSHINTHTHTHTHVCERHTHTRVCARELVPLLHKLPKTTPLFAEKAQQQGSLHLSLHCEAFWTCYYITGLF